MLRTCTTLNSTGHITNASCLRGRDLLHFAVTKSDTQPKKLKIADRCDIWFFALDCFGICRRRHPLSCIHLIHSAGRNGFALNGDIPSKYEGTKRTFGIL